MNEKEINNLIAEVNSLLADLEQHGDIPSSEFLALLEEITDDLVLMKKRKSEESTASLLEKLDTLVKMTEGTASLSSEHSQSIINAIEKIKIDVPAPQVVVNPPEIKVEVPPINVPPAKIPQINVPPANVVFPDEMTIKKSGWFIDLWRPITETLVKIVNAIERFKLPRSARDPIAVQLSDGDKFYRAGGGGASGGLSMVNFARSNGDPHYALVDVDGNVITKIQEVTPDDTTKNNPSFSLFYTNSQLTRVDMIVGGVAYRKTLTWTGDNLTGVSVWSEV